MIRSCILWLSVSLGAAQAAEYREVRMTNGRIILAEVQGFTPDGVTLGLPQGTMVFPPDELDSMEPLTEAAYKAQGAWKVVILDFTASDPSMDGDARTAHMLAKRVLASMPGTISGTPEDIPVEIRKSERRSLAACRTDLLCAIREGEEAGVDVVMLGQIRESDGKRELRLGALWVKHPTARKRISIPLTQSPIHHRAEIYESQYLLLSLKPPSDSLATAPVPVATPPTPAAPAVRPPPEVRTPPKPRTPRAPLSDATVRAMAWAPVPGLPHLVRGDKSAFAGSLAVAGVGAGIGISMAGQATYTRTQFVTVSVLSTYVVTTMANHLFWPDKARAQPPPR